MSHPGIPIIDSHCHVYDQSAVEALASVEDACGFRAFAAMSLSQWKADMAAQNPLVLLCKARYPGRAYAFGGLQYDLPGDPPTAGNLAGQAQRLLDAGCDGMKMLEGKPDTRKRLGIPLDDPVFDACFKVLEDRRIPITYHVADPEEFWDPLLVPTWAREQGWFYGDGTYVSKHQLYSEVDGFLRKFPGLRVVFAHFYFLSADIDGAARFLDRFPSVCLDITPGREMYFNFSRSARQWRDFFIRYQDRILYGTDQIDRSCRENPSDAVAWARTIRDFLETEECQGWGQPLCGLHLPQPVLEKIYAANFQRLAGLSPKPLNFPAAAAEISRTLELCMNDPNGPAAARAIEAILAEIVELKRGDRG